MTKMVSKLKRRISRKLATKASYTRTIAELEHELALLNEKHLIVCKQYKKSQKIIKKQNKLLKRLLKGTEI